MDISEDLFALSSSEESVCEKRVAKENRGEITNAVFEQRLPRPPR